MTFEDALRRLVEENGRRTRADATVTVTLNEYGVSVTVPLDSEAVVYTIDGDRAAAPRFAGPADSQEE